MKKKVIFIVLSVFLVLIAATPIKNTMAYFTDVQEAKGEAKLTLKWQTDIEETLIEEDKSIVISNTGEVPVIVRVNVYAGEFAVTTDTENMWTLESDGWWYYTEVLPVGGRTTELNVDVAVENAPDYDFNIVVVHESSRVVYENGSSTTLVKPEGWSYVPPVSLTVEEGGAEHE